MKQLVPKYKGGSLFSRIFGRRNKGYEDIPVDTSAFQFDPSSIRQPKLEDIQEYQASEVEPMELIPQLKLLVKKPTYRLILGYNQTLPVVDNRPKGTEYNIKDFLETEHALDYAIPTPNPQPTVKKPISYRANPNRPYLVTLEEINNYIKTNPSRNSIPKFQNNGRFMKDVNTIVNPIYGGVELYNRIKNAF